MALLLTGAGPADNRRWYTGAYSFSDELGGFRILSVSGTGTKADPIEVTQEFNSASPVTLVIRAARSIRPLTYPDRDYATGFIHMRIVALNNSGLAWIEFEFELQEVLGEPSDFFDGLSFDQNGRNPSFISSDRFVHFEAQYEPHDRLLFSNGHVDPLDRATFSFFIIDITPVSEFYLVQDPRIPSS